MMTPTASRNKKFSIEIPEVREEVLRQWASVCDKSFHKSRKKVTADTPLQLKLSIDAEVFKDIGHRSSQEPKPPWLFADRLVLTLKKSTGSLVITGWYRLEL